MCLRPGSKTLQCQRPDARGIVDGELLHAVTSGRVAYHVRAGAAQEIKELDRIADQLVERERRVGRGHL